MAAPPTGGVGGATQMRPMMGTGVQGMVLVRTGVEALQKALMGLPMGSELHTAVLKAITEISRRMESGPGNQSEQIQALGSMARDASNNPQVAQLAKMFQQGGGPPPPAAAAGAPPGGPPA